MRSKVLSFVLCVGLHLFQLSDALYIPSAQDYHLSRREVGRDAPQWEYYHGVDAPTHQANYDNFSEKGYRMISLSSYGPETDAQYAAVWIKRSGPAFTAIHNVNFTTFQAWVDGHSKGYVPTLVTATGAGESAVFSGVMEVGNATWMQKCNMTEYEFGGNDQGGRSMRQILKTFRQYGTPSDYRFCAIWHADPYYDQWDKYTSPTPPDQFQAQVDTQTSKPYWRPASISISEDGNYTSLFTDTSIGQWILRHNLTAQALEVECGKQKESGTYPVHLTGGGSENNTRYAVIFATQDVPSPRTWRVTGRTANSYGSNGVSEAQAESLIKSFMQKSGVRQVQLSIGMNGTSVLDRAYTWSEPERPTTRVNDTFLLASVSKAFCAAAIQSLFDVRKLTPDTKVYPLLGYNNATDPRQQNVTVQHLIDHTGGTKRSVSGDPAYQMRQIALSQSGGAHPASLKDVVDYMYRQPLDYTPGEDWEYSNYGYMLMSYIVEHVTGEPYWTYLYDTIIAPENLNVKRWLTDPATHAADNVIQESANTGLSAREPLNPNPVAHIYGGDGQFKDSTLGTTGLAANANSLARFARKHAVWGAGTRTSASRDGTTSGTRTYMESIWNGVDWAMAINTRDFPNGDGDFHDITGAIFNMLYEL